MSRRDRRIINDDVVVGAAPDGDQLVHKFVRRSANDELRHALAIYLNRQYLVERFLSLEFTTCAESKGQTTAGLDRSLAQHDHVWVFKTPDNQMTAGALVAADILTDLRS